MSAIGDRIKNWCQEESLDLASQQDDEAELAYVVTLPGEPRVSARIRHSGAALNPMVVTHTFEISVPEELQRSSEGQEQISTLLKSMAAARPGLTDCKLTEVQGKPAAEVSVTLHEDGLTKQCFLGALEDMRKMRLVVGWGLEGMSQLASGLSDARAAMEDAEALAAEVAQAAEVVQEAAAAPEAEAPSPSPAAAPEEASPAGRFCPNCGKQAKPGQRFCIGCGTSLEGQG